MAKKKRTTSPALYEMMKPRRGVRASDPEDAVDDPDEVVEEMTETWLAPGRALRLPVGYFLIAAAVVAALLIAVFVLGYQRGESEVREVADQQVIDATRSAASRQAKDPLTSAGQPALGSDAGRPGVSGGPETGSAGSEAAPIVHDPRQAGLYYFRLMETNEDGAIRLAEFCRDHGLDAYVVKRHNSRFHQVIALPAFEPGTLSSPAAKNFRALIRQVGAKWQRTGRGTTNLGDAYPVLHTQ